MNEFDPEIQAALANRKTAPQHRPDFFETLETELGNEMAAPDTSESVTPIRRSHKWRRIVAATATPVAAAVIAAVLLTTNNNGTSPGSPAPQVALPTTTEPTPTTELKPLLASEIIKKSSAAFASVKSISGTVKTQNFPFDTEYYKTPDTKTTSNSTDFRLTSEGRVWTKTTDESGNISEDSYDPQTGEAVSYSPAYSPNVSLTTGNSDDPRFSRLGNLDRFTSSIRSLETSKDPSLKEVVYDGRPAWELQIDGIVDMFGITANHWVVTLDQSTSFPLRVYGTYNGQPAEDTKVSDLKVNPALTEADFKVTYPKTAKLDKTVGPFQRVDVGGVEKVVGYKPFIPTYLPDGFALSSISVTKDAGPGGPEGLNLHNRNLVQLTYRRGLQTIIVNTRDSADPTGGYGWNDPFSYEGEPGSKIDNITIKGGAFDGVKATVVAEGKSIPHIWAIGAHWLLGVAGDANHDDLIKIAQSMQQQS